MGMAYAISLFTAAELRSFLMSNYLNESIRVATGIQTVLTTAVYDKVCRIFIITNKDVDSSTLERCSSSENSGRNRQSDGNRCG